MTGVFTKSIVEEAALAWLEALGYSVLHGPEIADGEPSAERSDPNYHDAVSKTLISCELRVKDVERHVEDATA